ncbi:hypothetical protein HanIR_Chr10g0486561 [Helianthus annuus]|nr:hypothetical protein HanIR_Chr10g0486561 [Helianthus annuus]
MWLSPAGCWICVTVFRRLDEGPCFRNSTVRLGGQRDQLPFFFSWRTVYATLRFWISCKDLVPRG